MQTPRTSWMTYMLAITLACAALYPLIPYTKIQPLNDELYHITAGALHGEARGLNPYHPNYQFSGHPPGYPISLFLWSAVFGADYVSAHFHALAFSWALLVFFFLFCSVQMSLLSAFLATLVFSQTYMIHEMGERSLGDIPMLAFIMLSLYWLSKGKYKWTGFAVFASVFFRESGLALAAAIVGVGFLIAEDLKERRKILSTAWPSLLALAAFLVCNLIFYGTVSRHPYATKLITHKSVSFFSFGEQKWPSLLEMVDTVHTSLPPYSFLLVFAGVLAMLFKKWQQSFHQRLGNGTFFVMAVFFLAFFTAYADNATRDMVPVVALSVYALFFALEKWFPSMLGAALAILYVVYFFNAGEFRGRVAMQREARVLQTGAQYLETHHAGRRVCLAWPLERTINEHGYFTNINSITLDCINPEVVCLYYSQEKNVRAILMQIIEEKKFKSVKRFSAEFYPPPMSKEDKGEAFFDCYQQPKR